MATPLRYVGKLSGHLINNSKHLGLLQQSYVVNQCKQYSRCVQPQFKASENNYETDNREFSADIVTKIKVERLNVSAEAPKDTVTPDEASGKPSPEKLLHVYNVLAETLPKVFVQPLDYNIYHYDIIFEDRIRNVRTEGLLNYVKQVALMRTIGHIKFAYVTFEILKITQHPEDGTVRVRWRILGISAMKVMFQFWKFKLWKWKEMFDQAQSWYDGYSTFYVNGNGKVVKHVADKMMPDDDRITEKAPSGLKTAKLVMMVAVIPRFSEVGWFI